MTAELWGRYWGKARPGATARAPDHPLILHSLDVAACAQVWLERRPAFVEMLAGWLGQTPVATRQLLTLLLAAHDLGKFAESFQFKVPDLVETRFQPPLLRLEGTLRHDEIGALFFESLAQKRTLPAAMQFPRRDHGCNIDLWKVLLASTFGHHGVPPVGNADTGSGMAPARLDAHMSAYSCEAAAGFFGWCVDFFLREPLASCSTRGATLASWWISGMAVLADWLGSNTTWFPYADAAERALPLECYWHEVALPRARRAIDQSGVLPVRPLPYRSPSTLLPSLHGKSLRPAQQLAAEWPIPAEPQLFVLEDATGSGKTEAALLLAARVIDAGLADGLFFGLPTQATADQMFERVTGDVPQWFDSPALATLVLAHGARDQSHAFLAHLAQQNDAIPGEGATATLRLTDWLAQSNKRALLAQIGVGTLDQVLLAGLRVRHQSLRVLGLFRKVLIVDEVHSYDAYMTRILLQTLELHAASGGSAILLSATLPRALRSQLLEAYAQGMARASRVAAGNRGGRRRAPAGKSLQARSLDYPLLTHWAPSRGMEPREQAFPAAPHSRRDIAIDYISREDEVLERIAGWHAAGQAVVWIRNTVADADTAWQRLCERFGIDACTLFHARFAGIDRRHIQGNVLAWLGRDSDANLRRGRIIVTTQVFQESLDADTDQMVCDLCPADVLLQRLGRYRRHLRDPSGNRLPESASVDERAPSSVVVFGPDRDADPDQNWYVRFSRGAAHVYAAHGVLYRTARAIGSCIALPEQFRQLVEAVYAEEGEPIPPALQTAEDLQVGEVMAQNAQAVRNAIVLADGYQGAGWRDEERIGTRLGDSIEAVLVRVEEGGLVPWAQGRCESAEDPWALSGIRVPGRWLQGSGESVVCTDAGLAGMVEQLKSRNPALKFRLVLPLVRAGDGYWECTLAGQRPASLRYCDRRGLQRLPQ